MEYRHEIAVNSCGKCGNKTGKVWKTSWSWLNSVETARYSLEKELWIWAHVIDVTNFQSCENYSISWNYIQQTSNYVETTSQTRN